MITLDENDNLLTDPDLSKGQINSDWRRAFHRYVVDAEEKSNEEVVTEHPNGGKDVAIVVDVPERGHWVTHLESSKLVDFGGIIPGDAPRDSVLEDLEPALRSRARNAEIASSLHMCATNRSAPDTFQSDEGASLSTNDTPTFTQWARAACIRATKTTAQALVTLIGADMVSIVSLDWAQMLGVAATMAVVSLLTSIAGIPEVDAGASIAKIARNS
ncbi:holin [Eggerthella sinensis]|jgi:hypothetical protein|nr:holin [Eggerthella sinensis]